jgi:YHS domain-containing protein
MLCTPLPSIPPILLRLLHAPLLSLALATASQAADAAPTTPQPEFAGQCTEALAEGRHLCTDCTSTWTDQDGKTYCFSGDAAKKSFLENPTENLQRARAFIAAGNVESTEKAMQDFTGTDAETVVKDLINSKLKANNGIFPLDDPRNGDHLKLSDDDVNFTRTLDGYGFFPDVKFHDSQDAQKKYLIDFWVSDKDGTMTISQTKVHKVPELKSGQWIQVPRYEWKDLGASHVVP